MLVIDFGCPNWKFSLPSGPQICEDSRGYMGNGLAGASFACASAEAHAGGPGQALLGKLNLSHCIPLPGSDPDWSKQKWDLSRNEWRRSDRDQGELGILASCVGTFLFSMLHSRRSYSWQSPAVMTMTTKVRRSRTATMTTMLMKSRMMLMKTMTVWRWGRGRGRRRGRLVMITSACSWIFLADWS